MIRQFIRSLGTALLIAGLALIIDAGLTVVWQEPLSAAYSAVMRGHIDDELNQLDGQGPAAGEAAALAALATREQRIAYLARSIRRRVGYRKPIARISIPKIHLKRTIVNGTDTAALRLGPGLIESTEMPGLGGTTGIAGHRTTYSAPFHDINKLVKGDKIVVGTPYGDFVYAVERHRIVFRPTPGCSTHRSRAPHPLGLPPLYSASHRIIVFANLVRYRAPRKGRGRRCSRCSRRAASRQTARAAAR